MVGTYFIEGWIQDFKTRLRNTLLCVQLEVLTLYDLSIYGIYKREYYVYVTIPKLHPELLTAWRHCMKPSMRRFLGVPLAVWQCNSSITFQSKKLVYFQMKSFANSHKIPVSFYSVLWRNNLVGTKSLQILQFKMQQWLHTKNIELYQMTMKGCFLGHRITEMKKRKGK